MSLEYKTLSDIFTISKQRHAFDCKSTFKNRKSSTFPIDHNFKQCCNLNAESSNGNKASVQKCKFNFVVTIQQFSNKNLISNVCCCIKEES